MKSERSQRYVTEIYALWRGEGAAQKVLIKDFSASGCRVADSIDVELGAEIILEFFLQEDPDEDATRVIAEVMRRDDDGVGMLFTEVSDGAKEQIDFFLFERFAEAHSSTSVPVAPRGEPVQPNLKAPSENIKSSRSQRAMNSFFFEFGDKPVSQEDEAPLLEGVVQRESVTNNLSPFDEDVVEKGNDHDDDLPLVDVELVAEVDEAPPKVNEPREAPDDDEGVRSLPKESGAYARLSSDSDVLIVDDDADMSDIIHRFDARSKANPKAQGGPPIAPPDAQNTRLDDSLASLPEPSLVEQGRSQNDVKTIESTRADSKGPFFWIGLVALLLVLVLVYALCAPFGAEQNATTNDSALSPQKAEKALVAIPAPAKSTRVLNTEPMLSQTLLFQVEKNQLSMTLHLTLSAQSQSEATYVLTRTHVGEVREGVTEWKLVDSKVHFLSTSEEKKNAAVVARAKEIEIGAPLLGSIFQKKRTMQKHFRVPLNNNVVYVSVTTEVGTKSENVTRLAAQTTTRRVKEIL